MTNNNAVIVTNIKDNYRTEPHYKEHPMFADWKMFIPENMDGSVELDYNCLALDYDSRKPTTDTYLHKEEVETQRIKLTDEQFENWRETAYTPEVLCFILADGKFTYEDEWMRWGEHDPTNDILGRVIPGVCSCGDNESVLYRIVQILATNGNFPGTRIHGDIYADDADLGLAYLIDGIGGLTEHGSSIGGAWLAPKGVWYCLAAMTVLGEDVSINMQQAVDISYNLTATDVSALYHSLLDLDPKAPIVSQTFKQLVGEHPKKTYFYLMKLLNDAHLKKLNKAFRDEK